MTQKTLVQSGYLLPTTRSISTPIKGLQSELVGGGSLANVVFGQFDRGIDMPLPKGYVDIDTLAENYENLPENAQLFEDSRRDIAKAYYDLERPTLAAIRLSKGWSQSRLAKAMGTSQPHIARIETGREDVRISTVRKLQMTLGVPLGTIIEAIEISSGSI